MRPFIQVQIHEKNRNFGNEQVVVERAMDIEAKAAWQATRLA